MKKKTQNDIQKRLLAKKTNTWDGVTSSEEKKIRQTTNDYMDFLDTARTERTSVDYVKKEAEKHGFVNIDKIKTHKDLLSAKKIYSTNMNKNIALVVLGSNSMLSGINLCASHIDSPRIDIKQNPLYEDSNIALFKTHYYGGIKKFHWFNIPLALHGVIIRKDGTCMKIAIGDNDKDPVFVISDLLPHLSRKSQDEKKMGDVFTGEHLNLIVGSRPYPNDETESMKDRIKLNVLNLLNRKYGIIEDDFNSAELELVPAMKTRYVGFDENLIAGYGQDDRICAFTSMKAIFELHQPLKTAVVLMADKEEIGSEGATSMKSLYLIHLLGKLISLTEKSSTDQGLRECLFNSFAISADVDAAVDPTFKDVNDPLNAAYLNRGIVITKYTGHGGKYQASDANAEYVGKLRNLFIKENIPFQFAQLGKVDQGGGGTVAKHLAQLGMEVIDCGPSLLGMHSPYEIASVLDIYHSQRAYKVFLEKMK